MQSDIPQYLSEFRHSLDDKNRLTIPAAWREGHADTDKFMATCHTDGYISVLPPFETVNFRAKAAEIPRNDTAAQNALARFFASSFTITFDKQGRISLPDRLLRHAGIQKDAVLVGVLTKFNIYNPAHWAKIEQGEPGQDLGDIMRNLGI